MFLNVLLVISACVASTDTDSVVDISDVLSKLHAINRKEIKAAGIAGKKAKSPRVRKLAEGILTDHLNVDRKLLALAASEKIRIQSLPSDITAHDNAELMSLKDASPEELDSTFLEMTKFDHEDVIGLIKDARDKASRPRVRGFLVKVLSNLEQHLSEVKNLESLN